MKNNEDILWYIKDTYLARILKIERQDDTYQKNRNYIKYFLIIQIYFSDLNSIQLKL